MCWRLLLSDTIGENRDIGWKEYFESIYRRHRQRRNTLNEDCLSDQSTLLPGRECMDGPAALPISIRIPTVVCLGLGLADEESVEHGDREQGEQG